jgi:flagellar biosynthesis/type III secretory pathway chaperone
MNHASLLPQDLFENNDLVAYLQAVAERLAMVLEEETSHLRTQNVDAIVPLQEGKQKLSKAYMETMRTLQQQPMLLIALPDASKQHLKEALARFQVISKTNRQALKAARDARRYVLSAMREAAVGQTQELSAYGRKGQTQHAIFRRTPSAAAAPVALNQQM